MTEPFDIVRCKDCKYRKNCSKTITIESKSGGVVYVPLGDNGYCSSGERAD